ncbi:MAG: molybdopterin dinucleotide binding domain-containing protein [Bacillota bacterium]
MDYKYSNIEREMQVYGYDSMVKSHCRGCHGGCGVYIYIKDGKVVKIQGDPECPINHGTLCSKGLAAAQIAKRLGGDRFRLASKFAIVNEKAVWDAIIEEEVPHPVKMLIFISSNPILTRANSKEVDRALREVEFMAVCDFFLTPTAELADIVLPSATWLEMDYTGDFWKRHGWLLTRRKAIQVGECRSDHEILNDLAHRVGQGEFWWDDFEQGLDYILQTSGMTWKEMKDNHDRIRGPVEYYKYKINGFSTPSRKLELSSTVLEQMGYDPLPQFRETPEGHGNEELYKEYPYILITGPRQPGFFHTENRQIPWLRELHKDPIIEMHPDAAAKEGIGEGDWACIETARGTVRQRARITSGIDPRVVSAQHGWWFPEIKDGAHGWDVSNINVLIRNDYDNYDPAMCATHMRCLLCKIYPESKGESSHEAHCQDR